MSYVLVDFDHTLAHYTVWSRQGQELGAPIPAMVKLVRGLLEQGKEVRIFTARASRQDDEELEAIRQWCIKHLGRDLRIQCHKDFDCVAIYDDLAIAVEPNTGNVKYW